MSPRPYLATTIYRRHKKRQHLSQVLRIAIALAPVIVLALPSTTIATSVNNIAAKPKISFSFDDGLGSVITHAAPILAKYGLQGTSYIIADCPGTKGTCRANPDADYMSWDQITQLHDKYGWEIGSHSLSHPSFSKLTESEQEHELSESKKILAQHGFDARTFATPYGDYNHNTLALAAKYYQSHRGFWDYGFNDWPYSDYLLPVQQVQAGVSIEQIQGYIDTAIANRQWLVLVFHDIKDSPSHDPDDFEYSTQGLDQIASYIKRRGIQVSTVSDGLIQSNVNLLGDTSFANGLDDGWSTDTPKLVVADSNGHGSYPEPQHAIRFKSKGASAHLFSPKITVAPDATYMIKSFLNVESIKQGEIGYYIDEYDKKGEWLSGQWKVTEPTSFVEDINIAYQPTSPDVHKARLQIYTVDGTSVDAYVDNAQWFPLTK
jgi:peptidoglycan/xylan/chitin deacetylase (PgdA/CDA1 family)